MMARIQEEVIVITVSKLHKIPPEDAAMVTDSALVSKATLAALEDVAQELLGGGVVVEVNKA
jgi:hypothetical protein